MSNDTTKTCSRRGCGKKLRSNNTTGVCGAGCLSEDAPASKRASSPAKTAKRPKGDHDDVLGKFRAVCIGLDKDPDEEIATFAKSWLDALKERLS